MPDSSPLSPTSHRELSPASPSSPSSQPTPFPLAPSTPLPRPLPHEATHSAVSAKPLSKAPSLSSMKQTAQRTELTLRLKELSLNNDPSLSENLLTHLTFLLSAQKALSQPDLSPEEKKEKLTKFLEQAPPLPEKEAISQELWEGYVKGLFASWMKNVAHDQSVELTNRALAFLPFLTPEEIRELLPHSQEFTFVTQKKTESQKNWTLFVLEKNRLSQEGELETSIYKLAIENKDSFWSQASPLELARLLNHSEVSIANLFCERKQIYPFCKTSDTRSLTQIKKVCPFLTKVDCSRIGDPEAVRAIMENISPKKVIHLDCSYCTSLTKIPETLDQLKTLNCRYCTSLTKIPETLDQLKTLDCELCESLTNLPKGLNKLKTLNCSYCTSLTKLPEGLNQLQNLDCSYCTSLTKLSEGLNQLQNLDCSDCTSLTKLSEGLNKLKTLDCCYCNSLTQLPLSLPLCHTLNIRRSPLLLSQPLPQLAPNATVIGLTENSPWSLQIPYKHLTHDPLPYLEALGSFLLNNRPFPVIHYIDEKGLLQKGIDVGGLRKDFITSLMRALASKLYDTKGNFSPKELSHIHLQTLGYLFAFCLSSSIGASTGTSLPQPFYHALQHSSEPLALSLISLGYPLHIQKVLEQPKSLAPSSMASALFLTEEFYDNWLENQLEKFLISPHTTKGLENRLLQAMEQVVSTLPAPLSQELIPPSFPGFKEEILHLVSRFFKSQPHHWCLLGTKLSKHFQRLHLLRLPANSLRSVWSLLAHALIEEGFFTLIGGEQSKEHFSQLFLADPEKNALLRSSLLERAPMTPEEQKALTTLGSALFESPLFHTLSEREQQLLKSDPQYLQTRIEGQLTPQGFLEAIQWENPRNLSGATHTKKLFEEWIHQTEKQPQKLQALLRAMTGLATLPRKARLKVLFRPLDPEIWPMVHTCFNQLDLPTYQTLEELDLALEGISGLVEEGFPSV